MLKSLFSHVEEQADFILEVQREMTKRPAIGPDNGGKGEEEKAKYLMGVLKKLGVDEIREINAPDSRVSCGFRPNIAAKLHGKSKKTVWIIGHMDVVPVGDENLWDTKPFEMHQDGDIISGRGVEDNQQAIASGLAVLKVLKDKNVTPDLTLGLLFVSDEETHSTYGLTYIMEAARDLIGKDDLVLVPDIGDKTGSFIEVAEKSCLWMKFTVNGKQCHASTPDEGVNSLMASSACILAMNDLYDFFPQTGEIFNPTKSTFVPSKKEANVENVNTVPGRDIFYMDCRVLPEINLDDVIKKIEEIAKKAIAPYGASISFEPIFKEQAPAPTSTDSEVFKRLSSSIQKLRNFTPKILGAGGQTVCAIMRAHDIPCVAWSTIISNAHVPNEKSSIINTISDSKIFLDMLFD